MSRLWPSFSGLALALSAAFALAASAVGGNRSATEAEARQVAVEFFRSINERRYERTCALLSAQYLARHRIQSRADCVLGLRIGFMWSQEIRFRVTRVHVGASRVVVAAVADGAVGALVLVRENGRLHVLSVNGR